MSMEASKSLQGPRFELRLGEEGYPPLLAQIADPPPVLYGICLLYTS